MDGVQPPSCLAQRGRTSRGTSTGFFWILYSWKTGTESHTPAQESKDMEVPPVDQMWSMLSRRKGTVGRRARASRGDGCGTGHFKATPTSLPPSTSPWRPLKQQPAKGWRGGQGESRYHSSPEADLCQPQAFTGEKSYLEWCIHLIFLFCIFGALMPWRLADPGGIVTPRASEFLDLNEAHLSNANQPIQRHPPPTPTSFIRPSHSRSLSSILITPGPGTR